jgi:death-on-curing protein
VEVRYLSVEAVMAYHARGIEEHGGLNGLRSMDLLESAVAQPRQSAFGEDAYESLAAKAAAYGYFIAETSLFWTGTSAAAATMLAFLDLNGGLTLAQTDDEIHAVFMRVGRREMSKDDFFAWVESSVVTDED